MFKLLTLSISLFLTACSSTSSQDLTASLTQRATSYGMKQEMVSTEYFTLYTLHKLASNHSNATLYIEGDGFAWATRRRISSNPTPHNNILAKMAFEDSADNVFYLARPCQYVDLKTQSQCSKKYWTSHRFAPEVIATYNQALDTLKQEYGIKQFNLIGYSGGGAVATILAAQRSDVVSLVTIAGNLDHVAVNSAHQVSQMPASLNPINYADKLKNMPQFHYSGSEDEIVFPWITQKFVDTVNNPRCVKLRTIEGATHSRGWISAWRSLSKNQPQCDF